MADEKKKEKEVTENGITEAHALPKAIVRRVVKDKLSQLSTNYEMSVLRDSLMAFSESARIFIHYLSATANDICKEANRQIINAEDVFKALEEIEFSEFIDPLRAALDDLRQKNARKKAASSKAKETSPKAKASSKPKGTSPKAKETSPKAKETSAKAKETNKNAKRKEPATPSESGKKRRVVENNRDNDSA